MVAIDTMRAPAGVPVTLEVTSPEDDVIHSWWIPALGGKIDAIPGVVNETWFEADEPGTYDGQCAELCGLQHANMLASVEVMDSRRVRCLARVTPQRPERGRRGARRGDLGGSVREVPWPVG